METDYETELIWLSVKNLIESSELSYKFGDYERALLERKKAKYIALENTNSLGAEDLFKALIKSLKVNKRKYNLIDDYLTKIEDNKRLKIIKYLENLSKSKFQSKDFKGAIRALRRSEKYY